MSTVRSEASEANVYVPVARRSTFVRRGYRYLFVIPMLIFMLVTMAYPVFANVQMSFYDLNVKTFSLGNAPFIGPDNYLKLMNDSAFWHSVGRSFTFTGTSLGLQFLVGFALALFFNRPFPGNGLLRALLLLAWLLPAVVVGTLFRWMLDGDYGVTNHLLRSLGLMSNSAYWLIDPGTAMLGVIAANAWVGIPFNMVLLLAGLQSIPSTLYEAASIDGADPMQRFFSITVPLMRPVAFGVLLLAFIYTFKVFELIYVMTGGGPVDTTSVLPIHTFKLTFTFFRFGEGAAAATVLLLGLLLVAIGYFRLTQAEEVA